MFYTELQIPIEQVRVGMFLGDDRRPNYPPIKAILKYPNGYWIILEDFVFSGSESHDRVFFRNGSIVSIDEYILTELRGDD